MGLFIKGCTGRYKTTLLVEAANEDNLHRLIGLLSIKKYLDLNMADSFNYTALERARSPKCVHLLIQAGAKLRYAFPSNNWNMPGDTPSLLMLISVGADPMIMRQNCFPKK